MWNLINAPETEIFGIAIALMVLLGVFEIISMLAGGISDWLDNLLPDSLTELRTPRSDWMWRMQAYSCVS